MSGKPIRLGFILHGAGRNWGSWQHPHAQPDASTSFDFYRRQAQTAEAGKLDFLFVADSVYVDDKTGPHYMNRFEPLTILSAIAGATSHIGLVGTATTSYSEPYTVARQFASLDMLSGGRAGWNVVTSAIAGAAANYGREVQTDPAERYRMAAEHVDVVKGLWDSWEDDALPRDKESGVFFDPAKLHRLDHEGEFFRVRGPLNISRSPQGSPLLFQAGASATGLSFAARYADAVFASPADIDEARTYYAAVKGAATAAGRDPDKVVIMPSALPLIARDESELAALYDEMRATMTERDTKGILRWILDGVDFSSADPAEPFPELSQEQLAKLSSMGRRAAIDGRAKGLAIGEVAFRLNMLGHHFAGDGEAVAEGMIEWVDSGAADGFIIYEALPGQLEALVNLVIPALQRRGRFRTDYDGRTLRDNLGLPFGANRYAAG